VFVAPSACAIAETFVIMLSQKPWSSSFASYAE
jgi:hypothetical protein